MRNFGLVGKKLDYSFSKSFFEDYFYKNNIVASFNNFEIETISEINTVFNEDISGLTVTIPYKESIIPYLNELSDEAGQIGAVNVIEFSNGKKIGHNTDAFGFKQSIKPFLTNQHERALILGTGGGAKAVAHVLKAIGIDIVYCSRNPNGPNQYDYDQLNANMIKACKLIVNCTPIGTFPNVDEGIQLPFESLTNDHLVADLIYNPAKTLFLKKAEEQGATILNGQSMLKEQALKAWEIWNK